MTTAPASTTASASAREPIPDEALLSVVAELAAELHPGRRGAVTLDTRLEDDIGLDSLAVTGRSQGVIIRAGRHLFPYEIEEAVGALPGLRRGGVAVFSAPAPARGTEKVVIVAETRAARAEQPEDLRAAIDACTASLDASSRLP